MDFIQQNNKEREFLNKDYPQMKELVKRIRTALSDGGKIVTNDLDFSEIIDYENNPNYIYITLFQEGLTPIRWGACRKKLEDVFNRDAEKIKSYKTFPEFDVANPEKCRIMVEYITDETPVETRSIQSATFSERRFEPGVTGIKLILGDDTYFYTPTDAWVLSQMSARQAINTILRKTYIKNLTNSISERIDILKKTPHECFIIKSRAFVSFKDEVLPIYRGNVLYEYSPENIKNIALAGADWILKYQKDNGQFLYYYDAKEDNYVDHEHPDRPEDNLYYNDLRHCGAIVALVRAYQATKDKRYLEGAKKALDFIITLTQEHDYEGEKSRLYLL